MSNAKSPHALKVNNKNSLKNSHSKATQKSDTGLIPDVVTDKIAALAIQVLEVNNLFGTKLRG